MKNYFSKKKTFSKDNNIGVIGGGWPGLYKCYRSTVDEGTKGIINPGKTGEQGGA